MPKIHKGDQRTDDWHQLRLGRLNGSTAAKMLSQKKPEPEGRRTLREELSFERVFQKPAKSDYMNAAMQWGIDHEQAGLLEYSARTLVPITQVSYVEHESLMAGCSPDGLISDIGAVELKCPQRNTHWRNVQAIHNGVIPVRYHPQLRHTLWVTGRDYIDFCSYHPEFEDLSLGILRFTRKDANLEEYEALAVEFLTGVDDETVKMSNLLEGGIYTDRYGKRS